MEFLLISLPTYTLCYCGYALTLLWSSCYSSHVIHCDCDCDCDVITCDHPSHQKKLWYCDKVMWLFPALHLVIVSPIKEKEKEKKRNINNDLAVLPSHVTTSLLGFLVLRNFSITRSMGLPCCPFHLYLLPSTLELPIFFPLLGLSPSSFFLLVSCPSIISNFFLTFPSIPGCIACPTIHIAFLLWTSLVILLAGMFLLHVLVLPHLPYLADIPSQILRSPLLHSLNSPFLPKYQIPP